MGRLRSQHIAFDGTLGFYEHDVAGTGPMRYGIFMPKRRRTGGALIYLAGLTCTEETFMIKAGALRFASELGMPVVTCDTSPRGTGIPGVTDDWQFGEGAGFYLDATRPPYAGCFEMERYVMSELPRELSTFDISTFSVTGHSMGGHGALTLALRNPGRFRSVSAFAPICAPSLVPWGERAFTAYLGPERDAWVRYDASALMAQAHCPFPKGVLIHQGLKDPYLQSQLLPEHFAEACDKAAQPLELIYADGYDHGYYFVSTHVEQHLKFHADVLADTGAPREGMI